MLLSPLTLLFVLGQIYFEPMSTMLRADPNAGCIPDCMNKQCGDDGCGGSCGACLSGPCQDGACLHCQHGDQLCDLSFPETIQICQNGTWIAQSCSPGYMCTARACRPVCDRMLEVERNPAVCFFPHPETKRNWLITNNVQLLSMATLAFSALSGTAEIQTTLDPRQLWPWSWRIRCAGGQIELKFRLNQFRLRRFPDVSFQAKLSRAGQVPDNCLARFNYWNPTQMLSFGEVLAPVQSTVYYFPVEAASSHLDLRGQYNSVRLYPMSAGGWPCDSMDVNWVFLRVVP
jgi:hypothetical protein